MIFTTSCPFCRKPIHLEIDEQAFRDYKNGMKVQDAFPTLSASQREALITGICDECWDKMNEEE